MFSYGKIFRVSYWNCETSMFALGSAGIEFDKWLSNYLNGEDF